MDLVDDPETALKSAAQAMRDAYWKKKDISSCKQIAEDAIATGLETANATNDPDKSKAILGTAKAIAYDLGSFLWIGWDEPEIKLLEEDRAIGQKAAALNLRLAIELKRDALPQSRAHWLIGAYELAARNFAAARESFEKAAGLAKDANATADAALNNAYAALTKTLEDRQAGASHEAYERALHELEGVENGADLVNQVRTAEKVFSR